MFGVSIIICCYNSAKRLPDTLRIISQINQQNDIPWEVIVVDNISTDNTAEVAEIEWNKYEMDSVDFSIVSEHNAGLNYARRKGAISAKYSWLLYCDDDNWLDADYLLNFKNIINEHSELKMVCCGIAEAVFEKQPNKWFYNYQHLCVIFNILDYGYNIRISKHKADGCDVCGAGMFILKNLVMDYFTSQKHMILDRTGKKLNSGGDTDLVNYFLSKNYEIGQFSSLIIKHFIPQVRTTRKYIFRLTEGISYSTGLISYKQNLYIKRANLLILSKDFIGHIIRLNFFKSALVIGRHLGWQRAYSEISNSK
ncbi:glycosyltransferase family 2 protein [Pedobacter agri]|uniref:glycosyltransferase family 2 protein n=1 Tax=Pedobacter agri TaxID=454586 RepID=UPI00292E3041|nr:glycosyltransferase [Pedobacter agri]